MAEVFEKVDLPSGGWLSLRDPKQLTRGQRKPFDRARNRLGMSATVGAVLRGEKSAGDLEDSEVDLLEGLMEAAVVVLTDEWSFDAPVTTDALDDLSPEDYTAIVEAVEKHRESLIPDFEPGEKTDAEGSENPTGRSPASKTSSAASRRSARSQTPSESGGS